MGNLREGRVIIFGISGGIVGGVLVSLFSPIIGSLFNSIIRGFVSGAVIGGGIASGIAFSNKFVKNKSGILRTSIIVSCGTIGGLVGHLIYGIVIGIFTIRSGAPLRIALSGLTNIAVIGVIFSFGVSLGISLAGRLSTNRGYVVGIIIIALGGLFGNGIVELSYLLFYGKMNLLRSIFGFCVALAIAITNKREQIVEF